MTDILSILSPIQADMKLVDAYIGEQIDSEINTISKVNHYIATDGKRVRPSLVLLSALSCGYQGKDHIKVAAVVELIHVATLLHDDVIDNATERHDKPSASNLWGNSVSVLTGDFLYSRAFEVLCTSNKLELLKLISTATNVLAEGEVQQLINIANTDLSEAEYTQIIEKKTAKLFEVACQMGGVLAEAEDSTVQDLAHFGMHLGLAFQLIDDILDYTDDTGKEKGKDLKEGKLTLPIIHAMQHSDAKERKTLSDALGSDRHSEVLEICERSGSFRYTHDKARAYIDKATLSLNKLPEGLHRDIFHQLLAFLLERKY